VVDRYHTFKGVSFGGVAVAQFWCDFILWEAILNENPQTKSIVELGTWQGGFSLYLAAQAEARGLDFTTLDATAPEREIPGFIRMDIWRETDKLGRLLQVLEPLALLIDNGNKPRELNTFPAYLQDPRSLIVVHDWMEEVMPSDVPETLVPEYEDYCEELGSISRCFRVKHGD